MQGPLITFFVTGNAMLIWKRRKGEKASHNETSISALEGKNYALPDPMLGNFENLLSRNTALGSVKWKTLIWNLICKISRMLSQNLMKINAELVTGLSNQLLINPYKTKLDIFGSRVMISKTMKDYSLPLWFLQQQRTSSSTLKSEIYV